MADAATDRLGPFAPGFDLHGRGIALTGGGGHLGSALALGLAGCGATVVICGRDSSALEAVLAQAEACQLEGRIVAERADLARDEDIELLLDRVEKEAGALHGLVNNACESSMALLGDLARGDVDRALSGSVTNLVMASQAAGSRMLQSRGGAGGAIVNIASMYGLVSPQPSAYQNFPEHHNPPIYGAGKAGVIQFTRYAACHWGADGVRVNCVSPGPFPRDSVRARQDFEAELASRVPLGRTGDASELVGPVAFLLSEASSFVNGHNLVVDGGWTAW